VEFSITDPEIVDTRTFQWDPLERVCGVLGIARVRLSKYCREASGLRACEMTDRIQAEKLPEVLKPWLEARLKPLLATLRQRIDIRHIDSEEYHIRIAAMLTKQIRESRSGDNAMAWATSLGFASPSRLKRACLLKFQSTVEQHEAALVRYHVQKFFEELDAQLESELTDQDREDIAAIEAESAAAAERDRARVAQLTQTAAHRAVADVLTKKERTQEAVA
jgi:hypothetical protein